MTDAPDHPNWPDKMWADVDDDGLTCCHTSEYPGSKEYIRADLAQATPQWQPIETAPKDGTNILLLIGGKVIQGYWCCEKWNDAFPGWDVVVLPSHGCGCCGDTNPEPTHWMPLPKAPEESK